VAELRTVIVDDEPLARQALRRLLGEFPSLVVCAEADSVAAAAAEIARVDADVVFLDIELFGESGFALVPQLDARVGVVFVTAFNQYAIRAFEVNAQDYLLKPVTRERLARTVDRLRRRGDGAVSDTAGVADALGAGDVLLVQDGNRRRWIPLAEVGVIEANGDCSVVRASTGDSGIVWRRMHEWEEVLPSENFVRIHRGCIVNLDLLESFESGRGDRLLLRLSGIAEPCYASRRNTPSLRRLLRERGGAC
jgi:two-component system LytT family response regulator